MTRSRLLYLLVLLLSLSLCWPYPSYAQGGLPASFRVHTLAAGESLSSVAAYYGLQVADLDAVNADISQAHVGMQLLIPPEPGVLVAPAPQQDLLSLAVQYGLSPTALARANGLRYLADIQPGQLVFIPLVPGSNLLAPQASAIPQGSRERRDALALQQRNHLANVASVLSRYRSPSPRPRQEYFAWPLSVRGRITSPFGRRSPSIGGSSFHTGLDVAAPTGTPIVASLSGVVSRSGWIGAYGNAVYVDHGNGLQTRYAHMSSIAVAAGTRVQQGQVLGLVGNTGISTGPHLHFEIRINGHAVDPLPQLQR